MPLKNIVCPDLIVTNSASCERLFNIFGTTLTRLRSRLRTKTMVNLAELRLHLRNEHIQTGRIKQRLKRKLTTHHESAEQHSVPEPPPDNPADNDEDNDDNEIDGEQPTAGSVPAGETRSRASRSFHHTISPVQALATPDEVASTAASDSMKIEDIFDFTNKKWGEIAKQLALRGLEDEQEFYEVVDLDAAGEVDEDLDAVLDTMEQMCSNV
ncbi:hypothetical protein H0H81_005196 [Sphagnurus paluster]|uniref:HAT C-terminal dimerisation domain-containing protein n=1 Tax=Sphagnurus paluster TaxID=117069 RepID=A0A9P7FVX6_9AGAR|nr:hypothetical protein H0H81_005196 [Sphagnurus paluster]